MIFFFQRNEALLIFETDEVWTIKFSDDFFVIDPSLVTFLEKYPEVTKCRLTQEDFSIAKVFHAQRLKGFIMAFVKAASDGKIYLLQCLLKDNGNNVEIVRHLVPDATSANGQIGDITAVRFW